MVRSERGSDRRFAPLITMAHHLERVQTSPIRTYRAVAITIPLSPAREADGAF